MAVRGSSLGTKQMKEKTFIQENLLSLGKNKNSESPWHLSHEPLHPHIPPLYQFSII